MVLTFVIYVIFTEIVFFTNWFFRVDTTGWQLAGILYAICETLYISFFTSLILISPRWLALFSVLTLIVQLFPGASQNNGYWITSRPGLGGLKPLI